MPERISREPVIINILKKRQPLFPNLRPFREDILLRAELIGKNLRDPEFFAYYSSMAILNLLFSRVLGILG